ncbi:CbiX/SirB N-terminal domain-containing protein [Phaeobacter inhibens]|uniref:CbiX/SirB N-terminal domain-containing protein n=1 Tax=Phaeobacter inhibens TaxID=221822 RepID=UPI000C99A964|nr:CbiX/SirB N-terminal domain-containing protein [Phaeobacter inhibens]AUQ66016.1 cbiX domain-containing protein [Phaeobacter inhibens]
MTSPHAMSTHRPTAIITAHGQPSDPAPQERALAELADAVASLMPEWDIRSATLAMSDRLEQVTPEGALIYPFFMANGWFTSSVLPRRLQGHNVHLLPPFGLDPSLPDLACDALALACAARGWSLSQTRILLAAHGSARGPKAAEAAETFAAAMRDRLPGTTLATGYVEEDPRIAETARVFEDTTPAQPSLCLPFFAQAGEHVRDDIPDALADAGFGGDTLPVLGALPQVPQLIANALNTALSGPGIMRT